MATKFWFDSTASPGLTPTLDLSAYGHSDNAIYRRMNLFPRASVMTTFNGYAEGDHISDVDCIFYIGVSPPIQAASVGGTISANRIRIQCAFAELNASCNLKLSAQVWLVDSTGAVKATLMPLTREATEFSVFGTNTNRLFNQIMSGTQAVADRDRIVLGLGWGGLPTSTGATNSHNSRIIIGDDSATDFTQGDETETSAFNPWMTFGTDNFTFFDEDQPVSFLGNLKATAA